MRVYSVEFFKRDMTFVCDAVTSEIVYDYDYLNNAYNAITIQRVSGISLGDYIRITGAPLEITGVVVGIDEGSGNKNLVSVSFAPLTSLFDSDVLFDTDLQHGSKTLEETLADLLEDLFVTNRDTFQNIPGLKIRTTSSTADWGFNFKSAHAGMHMLIVNFWESIATKALSKYGVVINLSLDFKTHVLSCVIGVNKAARKTIEADLPNVVQKNVVVDITEWSTNKAIMYNGEDYSQSITYYLHPDGSYDQNNTDRIEPVIYEMRDILPEGGSTFAKAARSEAYEIFGGDTNNNLIEITVLYDDALVRPETYSIGQTVDVISNGVAFRSALSGYRVDSMITLVFGVIRQDLTKIIGGQRNGK